MYAFWIRSIVGNLRNAYSAEWKQRGKGRVATWIAAPSALLVVTYAAYGSLGAAVLLGQALVSVLMLETVGVDLYRRALALRTRRRPVPLSLLLAFDRSLGQLHRALRACAREQGRRPASPQLELVHELRECGDVQSAEALRSSREQRQAVLPPRVYRRRAAASRGLSGHDALGPAAGGVEGRHGRPHRSDDDGRGFDEAEGRMKEEDDHVGDGGRCILLTSRHV